MAEGLFDDDVTEDGEYLVMSILTSAPLSVLTVIDHPPGEVLW